METAFKAVNDRVGRTMDDAWKKVIQIAHDHVKESDEEELNRGRSARTPRTSTTSRDSTATSRSSRSDATSRTSEDSEALTTDRTRGTPNDLSREHQMVQTLNSIFALVSEGQGFLALIGTVICHLEYDDPVGMAFLSHILEKCALPSRSTMMYVSPIIINKLNKKPSRFRRLISIAYNRCKIERGSNKKKDALNDLSEMDALQNLRQSTKKRNAATLWALLAAKFAGEFSTILWSDKVRDILLRSVENPHENLDVRTYSLLALEKFANTRIIKDSIMEHEIDFVSVLKRIVVECEDANSRIFRLCQGDEALKVASPQPNCAEVPPFSHFNSFDSGFIPPKGVLLDEWSKYYHLSLASRWALDHMFTDPNKVYSAWDISDLNVIMNPFDATSQLKFGGNGLELRNDRPYFESTRATACVKKGKWYYEALVLTSGIMQIGWATSKCRFAPEDGYGVGDDQNGFAYDTYRSSVWADGSSVYPKKDVRYRCQPGDVIGNYIDLDGGHCAFFINGKDLGLHITFSHPDCQRNSIDTNRSSVFSEVSNVSSVVSYKTDTTTSTTQTDTTTSTTQTDTTVSTTQTDETGEDGQTKSHPRIKMGLYPAISLTSNQQLSLNFGDRPWLFSPPITDYRPFCKAGKMDKAFKKKVMKWVEKRGVSVHGKPYGPTKKQPRRPLEGADEVESPRSSSTDSDTELQQKEVIENMNSWDGPLCSICYAEPKTTTLMPCKHDGFGAQCASILKKCPLCRAEISERIST